MLLKVALNTHTTSRPTRGYTLIILNNILWRHYIIVLINVCFHNGPVIYPRLVIMAQGRLYWPEATARANTTFRGPLWLNRGHITCPLWKHPFLNTFINQSISILGNLHSKYFPINFNGKESCNISFYYIDSCELQNFPS